MNKKKTIPENRIAFHSETDQAKKYVGFKRAREDRKGRTIGSRHKIGGKPDWLQSDETPKSECEKEIYKNYFITGLLVGLITGLVLAGLFIYMGLLFLPLLLLIALFTKSIKRKLLLWGFIAGCIPSVLITWFYIWH